MIASRQEGNVNRHFHLILCPVKMPISISLHLRSHPQVIALFALQGFALHRCLNKRASAEEQKQVKIIACLENFVSSGSARAVIRFAR